MCAYNQVNGRYSCENDWLLNQVLKTDWGYPYFVMSDWGAVHSTARSAMAGLDQESGEQLDTQNFFADGLSQAIAAGEVPQARLDDMARRVLTSIFAHGLADEAETPAACRFRCERSDCPRHCARRDGSFEEPGPPAAPGRHAQTPRDRSSRRPRRSLGRRLFASHSPRRNRGEGTDRRESSHAV